jgi:hypothetical protein
MVIEFRWLRKMILTGVFPVYNPISGVVFV